MKRSRRIFLFALEVLMGSFHAATYIQAVSKILCKWENRIHKFHRYLTSSYITTPCETLVLSPSFKGFTSDCVKLGESLWKPEVSRGDSVNQLFILRWNLWSLFYNLRKNSQFLIGIRFNPFNVFQGKTLCKSYIPYSLVSMYEVFW